MDTLPAMQAASSRERLYYDLDGHATAAGHAVIAQSLFNYLERAALIP